MAGTTPCPICLFASGIVADGKGTICDACSGRGKVSKQKFNELLDLYGDLIADKIPEWKQKQLARRKDITTKKVFITFSENGVSPEDAFLALSLSVLGEAFQSSDMKVLQMYKLLSFLKEMGYNKDEVLDFKKKLIVCMNKFMPVNDFMG